MCRAFLSILAIFGLAVLAVPGSAQEKTAAPTKEELARLVEGNNQFAFDLYRQLAKQNGNIIFSPYSISSALAMVYAGAEGAELEQMSKLLRFPRGVDAIHGHLSKLRNKLTTSGGPGKYEFYAANALWGQKGLAFKNRFLETVSRHYDGELNLIDIADNPETARRTINEWIEKRTKKTIRDMLGPGSLRGNTRLVLANAVYFRGKWINQFSEKQTKEGAFHCRQGNVVTASMMQASRLRVRYRSNNDFEMVELPYEGERFAMLVILPRPAERGLENVEKALTASKLSAETAKMAVHEGTLMLPRFKLTLSMSLLDELSKLGMPATFTGMIEDGSLTLADVIHRAQITVNESGTEAAAATVADFGVRNRELPLFSFKADRPFLFLLWCKQTSSVLFMGRVVNPKSAMLNN